MSVTVDEELLATDELGLKTVGEVLSHLQRDHRLVVNLLIDGQKPDLATIGQVRQSRLDGRTLFIETVHPQTMAREVIDAVEQQLQDANVFKSDAASLLQQNHISRAMEKLGLCLTTWQAAQESVLKVSQLLRLNLDKLNVNGSTLSGVLAEFTEQLRQIKTTLMDRDFVSLCDILIYETAETNAKWDAVLSAMRRVIAV